jgi:hypothetical protein
MDRLHSQYVEIHSQIMENSRRSKYKATLTWSCDEIPSEENQRCLEEKLRKDGFRVHFLRFTGSSTREHVDVVDHVFISIPKLQLNVSWNLESVEPNTTAHRLALAISERGNNTLDGVNLDWTL